MKRIIIASIFMLSIFTINAQDKSRKEKIEALKIAYLTEKLDLSQHEAEKFWPIFNEYQKARKGVSKSKENTKLDLDAMSDSEIENFIDTKLLNAQKQLDIRKNYLEKFKTVLSIRKVAKLIQAEKGFRKEILKRLKERK